MGHTFGRYQAVQGYIVHVISGPDGDMSIPGEAGVDFPVFSAVPDTGFDCGAQQFPGIYGDVDGNCQVFHMCAPNGNADSCKCSPSTSAWLE